MTQAGRITLIGASCNNSKAADYDPPLVMQRRRRALRLTNISWVILSVAVFGADVDVPVISQMRLAVPGAKRAKVIARAQAGPELDVVVTLAGIKEWPPGQNQ